MPIVYLLAISFPSVILILAHSQSFLSHLDSMLYQDQEPCCVWAFSLPHIFRSQSRQRFHICFSPVCYEQKRLRCFKLFLSHRWHSEVSSEVRINCREEVKAALIERATRQSWCPICEVEWWQSRTWTKIEDMEQVRMWVIVLVWLK